MTTYTLARLDTQRGFVRSRLSIPTGPTTERPAAPLTDIRYDETLGRFEGYDGVSWRGMTSTCVTFTATTSYTYVHSFGKTPLVIVHNSSGKQVEVCIDHTDTNTVVLKFNGTLTNGVLILN